MQSPPKITVLILCWNGIKWIERCLHTVQATQYPNMHILVVDNASTDGTYQKILSDFPNVELIQSTENRGFAAGNNLGIEHALAQGADYVLLLNQDTVVHPEWIEELVTIAIQNPNVGILSPFQYDYQMEALDLIFKEQLFSDTSYEADREQDMVASHYSVPNVIGAAMMVSRGLIEALGVFDPIYFAYFEEKDLCRRSRAAGFQIIAVPKSRIGHYHGKLHPGQTRTDLDGLFLRNRQIFILKDPIRPFLKNLFVYLRYGLPNSLKRRYDTPMMPPSLGKAIRTQLDILMHLPQIARQRYLDRKRIHVYRTRREAAG